MEGNTVQASATELRPGKYFVFEGAAYVVKSVDISKTGKHGHAKCRIEAVGIKDGKKIITVMPGHDNVQIPIVEKKSAQVLSVHEDVANLMDSESFETFDIKIPEDLQGKVAEGNTVMYWIVMGDKMLVQNK
ncbi:MAG: translation initiation factor IF-5A [Candidatus Nanoarchaeia archaeon]|nr:translation initiation factor IF-5A [Candidatus Nanoarchaeia archaeon]